MNLKTSYMGLKLRSPLVPSASPLSAGLDNIKRMEDAGAAAVVLPSLFEEEVRYEEYRLRSTTTSESKERYPAAFTYMPQGKPMKGGLGDYLLHIARAKRAVGIPIIASLNAASPGSWTEYARCTQQAGADAIELNIYAVPTDTTVSAEEIERGYIEILREVKAQVRVPVAVKLSPFFTNLAHMARQLDQAGANGLVLFNRFYQPDIELEAMEVAPRILFSTPASMRLPLRWIAILHERVSASLAATGGIHNGVDALKMIVAGADVTMLCSSLMRNSVEHIGVIEREMVHWLLEHEIDTIETLKGRLSHANCADPSAFERAQYIFAVAQQPVGAR